MVRKPSSLVRISPPHGRPVGAYRQIQANICTRHAITHIAVNYTSPEMHVAVTRNAAKYEQECQASNLSWLMGDAPKGPHLYAFLGRSPSAPAPKAAMPSAGPRADAAAAAGSRQPKVPPASLLKEKELRLMQLPFPSSTKIGSRWLGSWLHRLLRLIEISSSHASVLRANIRSGYDEPMTGS